MSFLKSLVLAFFLVFSSFAMLGCDDGEPIEETGETVEEATEEAGETMEEAGEEAEDMMEDTAQ